MAAGLLTPSVASRGVAPSMVIVLLGAAVTFPLGGPLFSLAWFLPLALLVFPGSRSWAMTASFQIGVPCLAAICALLLYQLSHEHIRYAIASSRLTDDAVQISAFVQIVSTLYAICIAFTLWKATSDHDDLKSVFRDEASKISAIISLLQYFKNVDDEKTRASLSEIFSLIRLYVAQAIQSDLEDSSDMDSINRCVLLVEWLDVPEENDRVALNGVIRGFADLVMIRSKRLSLISNRIHPYLLFILSFISVANISLFFVFDSHEINVSHFVIPILSFMYTFLIIMIIDLNNPFVGYWSVKTESFKEIAKMLDDQIRTPREMSAA